MTWKILLSDLLYGDEEQRAVREVLESGWLTMGPRVERFEEALSRRLEGASVCATSSCTAALHLALLAHDIGPGDEVIVPSLTFAATANVVAMCGATPVFADIVSLEEPTISPDDVERLATDRTRAVAPVHYAGFSCRMAALERAVGGRGADIAIIEDAAHAFGGQGEEGRPLGTIGRAGAFSFFSNKNLVTGEGGALAAGDPALIDRARRLRSHGMTSGTWARHSAGRTGAGAGYDIAEPGLNYRPSEITAALGLAQLEKLEEGQDIRRRRYDQYVELLSKAPDVTVPFVGREVKGAPAYHIFPILAPDSETRDRIAHALREEGIQTSHHYIPLHLTRAYRDSGAEAPLSEEYARRELTLPLHPLLSESDVERIATVVKAATRS